MWVVGSPCAVTQQLLVRYVENLCLFKSRTHTNELHEVVAVIHQCLLSNRWKKCHFLDNRPCNEPKKEFAPEESITQPSSIFSMLQV